MAFFYGYHFINIFELILAHASPTGPVCEFSPKTFLCHSSKLWQKIRLCNRKVDMQSEKISNITIQKITRPHFRDVSHLDLT